MTTLPVVSITDDLLAELEADLNKQLLPTRAEIQALIARIRDLEEGYRSIISDHEFCLANGDTWGDRREACVETTRKLLPSPPKEEA